MKYHLLFKSAAAEMRAWRQLSEMRKPKVSVIYEITRGRKKPNKDINVKPEYNLQANFSFIKKEMLSCCICVVDITREPKLTSPELMAISSSHNGYETWVQNIENLHSVNDKVRPTLIVNPSIEETPDEYIYNITRQFDLFAQKYDLIAYRLSALHDADFEYDLEILKDKINLYISKENTFQIELDYEYIRPSTGALHAVNAASLIALIKDIIPNSNIVILGTSFPKNVTDIGNDDTDIFSIEEIILHNEVNRIQNYSVEYGDYGSINPVRNDDAPPVGVHLRARVDYPTSDNKIFYHRVAPTLSPDKQHLMVSRSSMYAEAAQKVRSDIAYSQIVDSWGTKMVEQAASSLPAGAAPSYWISVRMEAHICRQVDRLFGVTSYHLTI